MRAIHTFPAIIVACILAAPLTAQENPNNQGTGEKLGQRIDRGMQQLSDRLQKGWAEIRKSVDELTIQGRVYGRLHWDKALTDAAIDIQIQNDDTIVLSGSVPAEVARLKAAALAQDTIGVTNVINQLAVAPPPPKP
jgi:hyperosmotically inducible periplasmic protein